MSYYFFLGTTMLPIPPAKMTLTVKGKNKTIDLINEGEVNIIKTSGLSEISFDAQLPNAPYPFANYDTSLADSLLDSLADRFTGVSNSFSFRGASYFLNEIDTAQTGTVPIRLVISRMTESFAMLWNTNMLVTVEDYKVEESHDEGYDVIVPLKLKQYRDYGTKECEATTNSDGTITIKPKQIRPAPDKVTPYDVKITNQQSVWEAVKGISGGKLNWRTIMANSGISNPCKPNLKGTVLHLG